MAAAAYLAEVDIDNLAGYVIVAVCADGEIVVATNRCCTEHSIITMTNAIGRLVAGLPCGATSTD